MSKELNKRIEEYYDNSTFFYRFFWMRKKNLSMHYGFWDDKTKNIDEAFINENRYISDALGIKEGDEVLDAGCGVGGTAIWIAENYKANVTGINITGRHIKLAKKYAKQRGVEKYSKFIKADFCNTKLPDGSFDKIYGIESVCHAESKMDFLNESFRLLKPGGRLVVADGFLLKDKLNPQEKRYYEHLKTGWVLPNLARIEDFKNNLVAAGYSNIKLTIATDKVMKSSLEMYKSSKYIHFLTFLLERLHLSSKSNVLAELACKAQYHIFKKGIGSYVVFYAER